MEDELEFISDEAPVERHVDGANLARRKERLDELDAVHQQQADAVTEQHA